MPNGQAGIAIVGGGIAGLTTAAALARAGLRCEVYEQAPELVEVGAGLQLAPNAVRLLRGLGLGDRLAELAVRPEAIEMRRWNDGALISATPLGDACEERYGAPYLTVYRPDLQDCLLRLVGDAVRLDARCRELAENPDGVAITLEDGQSVSADVAVGADGIHSVVRALLADDRPRFSGQTIYRGVIPADRLPHLAKDPKVRLWLGPGQHCVCYPIAGGELISFGATTPAGDWRVESWSAAGEVEEMVRAYQGWHSGVLDVLTAADSVRRWALHDRDTITRWSTDHLTLVGDAAHPMLPFLAQGANQAIEDAIVLAACLRDGSTVAAALRTYEAVRVPRTKEVHQRSRGNSRVLHVDDDEARRDRDSELGRQAELSALDWLYGYDAELAAAG